jgi:predicted dehydrogenase
MSEQSTSTDLDIGVIGTGLLGTRLAEDVAIHPGCRLTAISDIDSESLRKAADRLSLGADSCYESHVDLLGSELLDAVIIATPHTIHFEQICDALRSGHHVLCEKPLCTEVEEARQIESLANETGKTVMVGYQRRVEAPFVAAKAHLDEAESPRTFVTAEITQPWIDDALMSWRGNPSLSGGGFLYDTGSHLLDAVLWLTGGTPETVSAEMAFADDDQRVDEHASLTIQFDTGAIATLALSAAVPRTRELIRVWTTNEMVQLTGREWNRRELTILQEDGQENSPYLGIDDGPGKVAAFYDTVVEGAPSPATVREAVTVTAVTEAAYESARTGRPVSINSESLTGDEAVER